LVIVTFLEGDKKLIWLSLSLRISAVFGGNGYFTAERAELRRGPQRRTNLVAAPLRCDSGEGFSRKGAKTQSATAFRWVFFALFAPLREHVFQHALSLSARA
jgi:hypothetical protein